MTRSLAHRRLAAAAGVALIVMLLSAPSSEPSSAAPDLARLRAGLPPGYTLELYANVEWPAEIQCASDGRCFVASVHDPSDEERSAIWVVYPDKSKQRIYRGPSYVPSLLGEKGLTGLALHPRFGEDDHIFFYWTIPNQSRSEPTYSVISSLRSDGSDYRELWRFTPGSFTDAHVAGGLVAYAENGHDYLLVAIGEYGAGHSQDLAYTQGKIHRFEILADSLQAPSDNPFFSTPGAVQSIYAVGFRNPFRMTRDAATGQVYITENGFRCSDRVYRLERGGNYGWPTWDACQDNPGYVQPIYEFRPAIGVTDIEVYHGPTPGWDGNAFICGFNGVPLRRLSFDPGGKLVDPQDIDGGAPSCALALGTRWDGALLYSRQGNSGEVFIIRPLTPQPRLAAMLSAGAIAPIAGQRIGFTLEVTGLWSGNSFSATIPLPGALTYLPGSTFGGAIAVSATQQIDWNPYLETGRSLRAGFDAVTFAPPGTPISVTAHITDEASRVYTATTAVIVGTGPTLDAQVFGGPAIRSGQAVTYQLLAHNRSISDTTFGLTTTLPVEAQFLRSVYGSPPAYDDALRAILWLRPLKADRRAAAAVVVSATQQLTRTLAFTTMATADDGSLTVFITRFMLDPFQSYLPLTTRVFDPDAPGSAYVLAPEDHTFGRSGTPPGSLRNLAGSATCRLCHDVAGSSIYAAWSTSAHGYSAIDPVFKAALHNAARQVKDVERWCTQCHQPASWLAGHPFSQHDASPITCAICHRAVDSDSADAFDQAANEQARAMGVIPPRWKTIGGSGALILDPNDVRRGTNFLNSDAPHQAAQSPFQGNSALCGVCHSVYGPHLAPDEVTGEFVAGSPDIAGGEYPLFLQATYPEWLNSQYAARGTQCQDCHMRAQPGYVAEPETGGQPRNVPSHQFAGGNLLVLDLLEQSGLLADTAAQRAAVNTMLSQAAAITTSMTGDMLSVGVTCQAGHKCPTGYEEGRAWIVQVEQLDANGQRIACSGCWDETHRTIAGYTALPGDPDYDPELTEFAVRFGITGTHAMQLGLPPGESFHLALNNEIFSDTRIPPCGWDAAAYLALGIAPTTPYPPGSCTATAQYAIRPGARQVFIRLLHWSHTTPYLEFLRDNGGESGALVWDAWQSALAAGAGRPTAIVTHTLSVGTGQ